MQMRLEIPFKDTHNVGIVAEPSYDKPGEQKLYIGVKRDGALMMQLFLNKKEASEFQKHINEAMQNIEW